MNRQPANVQTRKHSSLRTRPQLKPASAKPARSGEKLSLEEIIRRKNAEPKETPVGQAGRTAANTKPGRMTAPTGLVRRPPSAPR